MGKVTVFQNREQKKGKNGSDFENSRKKQLQKEAEQRIHLQQLLDARAWQEARIGTRHR